MNKRPTLVDVARQAGVSKSLVSRAIRGDAGVSEASRVRILHAAADLGYRSNRWARSLKRGQADLIGVLLTDLDNTYHTDVVHGVEDRAAELGYGVVLTHGRRDPAVLADQLDALQVLGVDGLIVASALLAGPELATVAAETPLVVVGRPQDLPATVGAVANNDEHGARMVVEHLVALGHRRIAHVTGSTRPASRARRAAYAAAMTTMALAGGIRVVDADDVAALVEEVVARHPAAPTAVFAANDRIAARVLLQAIDAGLAVPDDLSVVGYDNTSTARMVRPQLTTVDQPRHTMGRRAMEQLAGVIDGTGGYGHDVLEPGLVVRGSTGPPGAGARSSGAP